EKPLEMTLVVLHFEASLREVVSADHERTEAGLMTRAIQQVNEVAIVRPVVGQAELDVRVPLGNNVHRGPSPGRAGARPASPSTGRGESCESPLPSGERVRVRGVRLIFSISAVRAAYHIARRGRNALFPLR